MVDVPKREGGNPLAVIPKIVIPTLCATACAISLLPLLFVLWFEIAVGVAFTLLRGSIHP